MKALLSFKSGRIGKGTLLALALVALLVSLVGASTGVGRAAAQATPSGEETATTDARPHRPMARASRLNRMQDRCVRRAAFAVAGARLDAALADLVGDGTLSQAEAEAVKAKLAEGHDVAIGSDAGGTPVVDADTESATRLAGPCARLTRAAGVVDTVAGIVGLPATQVAARRAAGESLAEIAESEGVSRDELMAALEAEIGEHLDAAVAAGHLSETERAEREGQIRARLEALVDHAVYASAVRSGE